MPKKLLLTFLLGFHFVVCLASDEIAFFNVGEGHCTLAYKQRCDPILIDAGYRMKVRVENNLQEYEHHLGMNGLLVIENLTNKILGYWNTSSSNNLNIILTHRDADHTAYIPAILERLRSLRPNFTCSFLLGGRENHYKPAFLDKLSPFLNPGLPRFIYSSDYHGLRTQELIGFLQTSGCITHLFCPTGSAEPNTWSIITRFELNRGHQPFSALIAGDADTVAQNACLLALGTGRYHELRSNIFLFPHHGGQPLVQQWIQAIDPEVIIISAGKFEGASSHPKAQAIKSIFWQGDTISTNTVEQLGRRLETLDLTYNRQERIWRHAEPHKIVYYGSKNDHESIKRRLATSQYGHFNFIDDSWYTGFGQDNEESWRCALINFPLYTLYSTGTMVFQADPLNIEPYKINFVDVPSETDLMVRWINDSVIDDTDDYISFHLLAHTIKRSVSTLLRQTARNISEAEKVFFLSFVIIPHIECQENEISLYREKNLLVHLNYFLPRVRSFDFTSSDNVRFFNEIIDYLFADADHFEGLDIITSFNDRCFLFNAFVTSQHLQEREHREDLFYLYYMIYSLCEYQRPQITTDLLQNLVQNFRQLNFRRRQDTRFNQGNLEDIFCKVVNIYNRCNTGERKYYILNINDLGLLVNLLYESRLSEADIKILSDILSVLPRSFNIAAHTTTRHLIALLPRIRQIQGDFRYITETFSQALLQNPRVSQLDILTSLLQQ